MSETLDLMRALAREAGFDEVLVASAAPLEPQKGPVHPQAEGLADDPAQLMEGAASVLILVMRYAPYRPRAGEAAVDAYYIASNRAHQGARQMAQALCGHGMCALATDRLRVKPLCARDGLGAMGRNALIAVGDAGTRVCLQTIITDVPLPAPLPAGRALDERCLSCRACLDACPKGALTGDGGLDIQKCLRAQPENLPLPADMRPLVGGSLLGCDICQSVCPRNACVGRADVPDALVQALRLDRLLGGDYKPLADWLGTNNARKTRILGRAALAAANEGRRDLTGALEGLTDLPEPGATHVRWALDRLALDHSRPGAAEK